jgi:hypothetical protein
VVFGVVAFSEIVEVFAFEGIGFEGEMGGDHITKG